MLSPGQEQTLGPLVICETSRKLSLFPDPEKCVELENASGWPTPGQASGFLSRAPSTAQLLPVAGREAALWEATGWHFQAGGRAAFAMLHPPPYGL